MDWFLLSRDNRLQLINQTALVNHRLSELEKNYALFIDQMMSDISVSGVESHSAILNGIRRHYVNLEKIGINWINFIWYAENNSVEVSQLGILEGNNSVRTKEVNNIFKYCKRLVYPNGLINGSICIEVSLQALESYITSVLHNEVELFLDRSKITQVMSGHVVAINFFDKKAWLISPEKSVFTGLNTTKYLYFLIGISFVWLVILRSKNYMIQKDNSYQQVTQAISFKKDLFWQLYLFHDSGNYFNFVTQNAIDAVINYFNDRISSLNLSISTRLDEDVMNYKINLYVAMRLLLNFLENTMSRIQQNGQITIQVSFLDKCVEFVYYDNRYISHSDHATQKNALSCFELTHDEMMYFIDNHQVKIAKESYKHQGFKAIFSLPVENHSESNNVVSIFEIDEIDEVEEEL